jgi:hypothetical protein
MNIPGYDAWRLRGPDESVNTMMEACEDCEGVGVMRDEEGEFPCTECKGAGEVEVVLDQPDDDYEYERYRDDQIDQM